MVTRRNAHARLGIAVVAIALLGAACGDTSVQMVGSESPPVSAGGNEITPPPMDPRGDTGSAGPDCAGIMISMEGRVVGLRDFVHESHAAIVGRLVSVSEPKWNSVDGKAWCHRDKDGRWDPAVGPAVEYREVVIEVEDVLYDSPPVPVKRGEHLTVRIAGNGTDTGPKLEPVGRTNNAAGPVVVGDHVLWVLQLSEHYRHPTGTELAVSLHFNALGNWRVEGDQALNKVPGRTVPYGALRARLIEVRHNPSRFPDPHRGDTNPLE